MAVLMAQDKLDLKFCLLLYLFVLSAFSQNIVHSVLKDGLIIRDECDSGQAWFNFFQYSFNR